MAVILETSLGDLTIDLYTEERPRCCLNFLKLCKIKYYNWCLFHSVQRSHVEDEEPFETNVITFSALNQKLFSRKQNLVAQTGDPTGTGRGGASVFSKIYGEQAKFFEMEVKPRIKHKKSGLVSMVNNGSNMHGSQFFITSGENLDYLDGVHTVFGEVSEGFDTLEKLNEAICDGNNRPYQDIRIFHTVILDDPYNDPPGLEVPEQSPEPTKEQLDGQGYIGVDEEIDDTEGKTEREVEEIHQEKEAKANAQILEMIGDLPAADAPPPENVLFVCKLNPVTTEEDLEIIFSRFGDIVSCEVIKDHKSGESLQYAFIEFKETKSCENAYFKMDNVLIDDRRIHVDFSQSVAKLKWKGKGRGVEHMDGNETSETQGAKYVVKNKSRLGQEYNLVMSDEETDKKEKKKKHRDREERTRDEKRPSKHMDEGPRQRSGGYKERYDKTQRSRSRSRSPKQRKRSPRQRDRSPRQRDRSPRQRDRSPRQQDRSPRRSRSRERSPKRNKHEKSKHHDRERHRDADYGSKYRDRDRSPKHKSRKR